MSKIMELADEYAGSIVTLMGTPRMWNDDYQRAISGKVEARAALAAEVEKLEKGPNMLAFKEIIDQRNAHADMSRKLEEIICEKDEALELSGKTLRSVMEQAKEIVAERDALREKLASVEKDAARYREALIRIECHRSVDKYWASDVARKALEATK